VRGGYGRRQSVDPGKAWTGVSFADLSAKYIVIEISGDPHASLFWGMWRHLRRANGRQYNSMGDA
jgi:hypothetical protein